MRGEQVSKVSGGDGRLEEALAGTLASGEAGGQTLAEGWASETVLVGEESSAGAPLAAGTLSMPPAGRTTVLPRVKVSGGDAKLVVEDRDRYEELHELGRGGVGEVALVRDNDIDRLVALKRLRVEQRHAGSVVRFAEEVRTIGQLEHPNIVPVHDVGVDAQGHYFFVMKYVEGQTMEQVIQRLRDGDAATHARFTFEYRTQIFMEVLRAIQYAHERGVIHRDIKPANIMIGPWGEVTVMDWGLAKRLGDVRSTLDEPPPAESGEASPLEGAAEGGSSRAFETQYGALMGTPAYMAPEQALGQTDVIGEASDVYSLGVVFHEFLTLRHYLAHKKTVAAMLTGVVEDAVPGLFEAPSPHQGMPPGEYGLVVQRATAKAPQARWGSVGEMMGALQMAVEGRMHIQCPVTFTRRMTRDVNLVVRERPMLAMAGFGLVGLLCVLGVVSTIALVVMSVS